MATEPTIPPIEQSTGEKQAGDRPADTAAPPVDAAAAEPELVINLPAGFVDDDERPKKRRRHRPHRDRRDFSAEQRTAVKFWHGADARLKAAVMDAPDEGTKPVDYSYRAYRQHVDKGTLGVDSRKPLGYRIVQFWQTPDEHRAARVAIQSLLTTDLASRYATYTAVRANYDALVADPETGQRLKNVIVVPAQPPTEQRPHPQRAQTLDYAMRRWRFAYDNETRFAMMDAADWFSARVLEVEVMINRGTVLKDSRQSLADQLQYLESPELTAAIAELDADVAALAGAIDGLAIESTRAKQKIGVQRNRIRNIRNRVDRQIADLKALLPKPGERDKRDELQKLADRVAGALGPVACLVMTPLMEKIKVARMSPLEERNFWEALMDLFDDIMEFQRGATEPERLGRAKKIVKTLKLVRPEGKGFALNAVVIPVVEGQEHPQGFGQVFDQARAEARFVGEYRQKTGRTLAMMGKPAQREAVKILRAFSTEDKVTYAEQLNQAVDAFQEAAIKRLKSEDDAFKTAMQGKDVRNLGKATTRDGTEKTPEVVAAEKALRTRIREAVFTEMKLGTPEEVDRNQLELIITNIRNGKTKLEVITVPQPPAEAGEGEGAGEEGEAPATTADADVDSDEDAAPVDKHAYFSYLLLGLVGEKPASGKTTIADALPPTVRANTQENSLQRRANELSNRLQVLSGSTELQASLVEALRAHEPADHKRQSSDAAIKYLNILERIVFRCEQIQSLLGEQWTTAVGFEIPDAGGGPPFVDAEAITGSLAEAADKKVDRIADVFGLAEDAELVEAALQNIADPVRAKLAVLQLPEAFVGGLLVAAVHVTKERQPVVRQPDFSASVYLGRWATFLEGKVGGLTGEAALLHEPPFAKKEGTRLRPLYKDIISTMENESLPAA